MSTRSDEVYAGTRCAVCEEKIRAGEVWKLLPQTGEGVHVACWDPPRTEEALKAGDSITVHTGPQRRTATVKNLGNATGPLVAVIHADATGLPSSEYSDPLGAYAAGWRDALGAAGKCGAYNLDDPRPQYTLCVRERGHTGKHDDMWKSWGDRHATAEQNRTDAGDHSRWLRDQREAGGCPA